MNYDAMGQIIVSRIKKSLLLKESEMSHGGKGTNPDLNRQRLGFNSHF